MLRYCKYLSTFITSTQNKYIKDIIKNSKKYPDAIHGFTFIPVAE